ncbi:copper-transporting P1-type ATPase [Pseudozyma hubeiensis SY62]|uniref:Copper-transporting P1-type ATPase n=1 Tax=Pseudozyma hubeiensis (strain SY62) TaxID=1305764 RepID=R9NX52_PSEHS|nr:copper-transporting P1-type ATPase [Pseudozyma hubeiensis SY62]GAC93136.1 copper-transporting P1-type ATPase [Pseudozyma hubeiensis SY62]
MVVDFDKNAAGTFTIGTLDLQLERLGSMNDDDCTAKSQSRSVELTVAKFSFRQLGSRIRNFRIRYESTARLPEARQGKLPRIDSPDYLVLRKTLTIEWTS